MLPSSGSSGIDMKVDKHKITRLCPISNFNPFKKSKTVYYFFYPELYILAKNSLKSTESSGINPVDPNQKPLTNILINFF